MSTLALAAALAAVGSAGGAPAPSWPDLSHPPRGPGVDGRRDAAVVVAVEDYPEGPDVPGARASAEDWVRWLARTRGVPLSRIHFRVDAEARGDRVRADLGRAAAQVREGGTLWFVFVGRSGPADHFLWPVDATPSGGALDPGALADGMRVGGGTQAVMVLDAGAISVAAPDVAVLSAEAGTSMPVILPAVGQPAWSYLALGGLWGWADRDDDGVVTVAELDEYAHAGLSVVAPELDLALANHLSASDHPLAQGVRGMGPDLVEHLLAATQPKVGGVDYGMLAQQAAATDRALDAARASGRAGLDAAVAARATKFDAATTAVLVEAERTWADLAPAREAAGPESVALITRFVAEFDGVQVDVDQVTRSVQVPEVTDAKAWLAAVAATQGPADLSWLSADTASLRDGIWLACASLSDPSACVDLGQQYELGLGGRALDPARAAALYARACDHLSPSGCRHQGLAHQRGLSGTIDLDAARDRLALACDLGDGPGCRTLAALVDDSIRVDALLDRGCALDDGPACLRLADDATTSAERRTELLAAACSLGETRACVQDTPVESLQTTPPAVGEVHLQASTVAPLAFATAATAEQRQEGALAHERCAGGGDFLACNRLGYAYETGGRGLVADLRRAGDLYARACEGGVAMACGNVGYLLESGKLGTRDYGGATLRYEAGCGGGNARSCGNLGVMYDRGQGVVRDHARANLLFQRGCTLGSGAACTNLGYNYEQGRGVRAAPRRAVALYEVGCERGNVRGCGNLGYLLWTGPTRKQDHARARAYLRTACEQDDTRACNNVAIMLGDGIGGPVDVGASNHYMEVGCRGGDANACRNLGLRYRDGARGLPVDPAAAALYFRQACAAGASAACAELEALP